MANAEKWNTNKPSPSSRGYDYAWQKMRLAILARDNYTCYLCNKKLSGADATVDHIVPISKSKEDRLNSKNLAACCRSCNSSKKNK